MKKKQDLSTETFVDLSREEKRLLLKDRARLLAIEQKDEPVHQVFTEIIVFHLATETYGIETAFVREAIPLIDFTPLPGTPPFVLGIVNVRGQIISVLDIKKFFDLPDKGLGELNKLIIIRNNLMEFGILADEIAGIQNIATHELQPPLPTHTGIRKEYLLGIASNRMIVLDAKKLLSDKKIFINEDVTL